MRIFGKNRREYPTGPPRPYSATLIDWIWLTSWQKAMALRQPCLSNRPTASIRVHVAAGCDHYVTKPYIPMQLAAEVSPAVARS